MSDISRIIIKVWNKIIKIFKKITKKMISFTGLSPTQLHKYSDIFPAAFSDALIWNTSEQSISDQANLKFLFVVRGHHLVVLTNI